MRVVQGKFLAPVAMDLHCGCELNVWRTSLDTEGCFKLLIYDFPGSHVAKTRANAFHAGLRRPHSDACSAAEPIETR